MSTFKKKILVATLDWGLGHSTRCVPLIRNLIDEGHDVILASNGSAFSFLKSTFPELKILEKPGYHIHYSSGKSQSVTLVMQVPKIIKAIYREHQWLKKVIRQYSIDTVYSDNCYGLWNKNIHTVFITHQLNIKCPGIFRYSEPLINKINLSLISKFDECCIPDIAGSPNYSGKLSHLKKMPPHARFIGILSRFDVLLPFKNAIKYDFLFLLSGPEPQRTIFENLIVNLASGKNYNVSIVRGMPGNTEKKTIPGNITWFNHVDDSQFESLFTSSKIVVCRSGYSTIMDMVSLGVNAVLVPTPGQSEQEYLARHNSAGDQFYVVRQENLNLDELMKRQIKKDQLFETLTSIQDDIGSRNNIALMQSTVINKNI